MVAIAQSFTFGPGGAYTATWDGVRTLTVTLTAGGAFVASFAGQNLAQVTASPEFQQLAAQSLAPVVPAALTLQAATPLAGVALINGTQTFLTWTPPNDGALHYLLVMAALDVTVSQTGGACNVQCKAPDGTQYSTSLFGGGLGVAGKAQNVMAPVPGGQQVIVQQNTPQTLGTATFWASIWGV